MVTGRNPGASTFSVALALAPTVRKQTVPSHENSRGCSPGVSSVTCTPLTAAPAASLTVTLTLATGHKGHGLHDADPTSARIALTT